MSVEAFVAHWGYLALAIGILFEGETALLIAGALAHSGLLRLPIVIAIAFVGSVLGDQGWFHFGRRYGAAYLERHPRVRAHTSVVERWLARFGSALVVGFRFLYGLRTATPILLGTARYPTRKFTVLNAVGAAIWATVFGALGYAIGSTVTSLMRRAARIEELAVAAIAIALVVAFGVSRLRASSASRTGRSRSSSSASRASRDRRSRPAPS